MSRLCPTCGTRAAPEARFCRLCGTLLKTAGSDSAPVSPRAETAPLSDEGRTTRGLSTEDGGADTHKVARAEIESLLRRTAQPHTSRQETQSTEGAQESDSYAAPATSALSTGSPPSIAHEDSSAATVPASRERLANDGLEELSAVKASTPESRSREPQRTRAKSAPSSRRVWPVVVSALLLALLIAAPLAFYFLRRAGGRSSDSNTAQPASAAEQKRQVEERLAEAESLLAAGNVTEAIARLRAVIKTDPKNARAHSLLAEALERTGAVTEAIDEYRKATDLDPRNEETQLRYADALRRVGRTDEAREIYQQLSSSSTEDVARTAKEKLDGLPPASTNAPSSTQSAEQSREGRAAQSNRAEESVANSSAAAPPPTASANGTGARATPRPQNDPVTSYSTAMKIIQGKDIKKMSRAELIRAYELFQYAQAGPNAADATRHLRQLDKELFERRKRKQ